MNVEEIMSMDVETCGPHDRLNRAAQIMWEHDCGVVPVVDNDMRVVGMLTDRDICMAAYTQGQPLSEISVLTACSHDIRTCAADDSVETAEMIMSTAQVRRIPVVNDEGKLCGILSLGDLTQQLRERRLGGVDADSIASTVEAISQPSFQRAPTRPAQERTGRMGKSPSP